jgi:monoamine oxidase
LNVGNFGDASNGGAVDAELNDAGLNRFKEFAPAKAYKTRTTHGSSQQLDIAARIVCRLIDVSINQFRVVVVGAGLAGLTAARELIKNDVAVTVLEARDRVGGRVLNHRFSDGAHVEVGGQWIGPTQDHALALAAELGCELFRTYDTGESVVSFDGRTKRFTGDTFGLPPHVLVEVGIAQKRLEAMAKKVPLEAPWMAARSREWDGQTLESWLRRNLRFEKSRAFWRSVTSAIFSAEASEISLLHFLFYCHSGGMLDRLMGIKDGAQEQRFVGGTQLMAERIAVELGSRVRCGEPVVAISQSDVGVEVVCETGEKLLCDAVVVTTPQHLIGRISFCPELSVRRQMLVQNVPMGAVIKCVARYASPFWRSEGLSGFAVSLDHPVSIVFDNSPPGASSGMLVGFIEGQHARTASALSASDRQTLVIRCLTELIGPQAASPTDYVDLDWSAERWTGGCYGGHLGPGVWTQLGDELRRPHGCVYFAGTETAEQWNGYIDGAISSGYRAANEVMQTNRKS